MADLFSNPNDLALASMGLRLMSTPGKFGPALGTSGLGALQDLQWAQQVAKQRQMQERVLAERQEELRRKRAEEDAAKLKETQLDAAYRGAFVSPAEQALSGGGGPTVGNAAAMQGLRPQISQDRLIEGLMKIDPRLAFQMAQPKPDDTMAVAPGSTVWSKRDNKPVFTAPDRQKEINPNQPFMLIDGKVVPNPAYQAYELAKARAGRSEVSVSYGAPVAGLKDGQPVFFQPDKGGGAPAIVPGVQPPNVVEALTAAAEGKRKAASTAELAYTTIDKMLSHPGLDTAVGLSSVTDPRNYIAGTEAQGAKALIDQAQGQAFLQAFESLKGGGQITQVEGEKATAAMSRLKTAQNERDFKAAAKELREIARAAYKRATGTEIAPPQAPSLDDLVKKYGGG